MPLSKPRKIEAIKRVSNQPMANEQLRELRGLYQAAVINTEEQPKAPDCGLLEQKHILIWGTRLHNANSEPLFGMTLSAVTLPSTHPVTPPN